MNEIGEWSNGRMVLMWENGSTWREILSQPVAHPSEERGAAGLQPLSNSNFKRNTNFVDMILSVETSH